MTALEYLTQQEAMERLSLSRYMIRKLEHEEGLPRGEDGYPWPVIRTWLDEFMATEAPALLSQGEVAERLGLSTRQVRRLGDAGIPREEEGYPWPEVREWYNEFKQQEALDRAFGGADDRQKWMEARARKEAALADLHEIDLAERRASMLHVDDLPELFGTPLRHLELAVRTLPRRIAGRLSPEGELPATPVGELAVIIRDEVHDFLEELADGAPFSMP